MHRPLPCRCRLHRASLDFASNFGSAAVRCLFVGESKSIGCAESQIRSKRESCSVHVCWLHGAASRVERVLRKASCYDGAKGSGRRARQYVASTSTAHARHLPMHVPSIANCSLAHRFFCCLEAAGGSDSDSSDDDKKGDQPAGGTADDVVVHKPPNDGSAAAGADDSDSPLTGGGGGSGSSSDDDHAGASHRVCAVQTSIRPFVHSFIISILTRSVLCSRFGFAGCIERSAQRSCISSRW